MSGRMGRRPWSGLPFARGGETAETALLRPPVSGMRRSGNERPTPRLRGMERGVAVRPSVPVREPCRHFFFGFVLGSGGAKVFT